MKERLIKQSLCLAKPEVLEVFTFTFVVGDPETALDEPFSVVLHASMAKSLFGSEPPLGKRVTIDDNDFRGDYRVTGVVVDPGRATFEFGALISTVPETFARRLDYWVKTANWRSFTTYVLLAEGANARDLEAKLPGLMANTMGESIRTTNTYHLQKLTRVHLYSGQDYGIHGISTGDIGQVYLFIALAGFILLIGCINFMNLATARASDRAREVGLRKVVGARRSQLAGQFLGEAMVVAGVACVVSLAMTHLALPLLNELSRKDLVLDPMWISALGCFAIFVGLISGSYPALALSGFRPAAVLRGSVWREPGRAWFREGLVTLQFAVSIGVIAVTVIVHGQLEYLRNKDLGFDKEQIVRLDLFYLESSTPKDPDIPSIKFRYSAVKEAFLRHPNVVAATATRRRQGIEVATGVVRAEGVDGDIPVQVVTADEDYLGFFGIELESGRNMTRGDIEGLWPDQKYFYLVNEAAVALFGWKDPVGMQMTMLDWRDSPGPVLGVVRDFHVKSLHHRIEPVVFDASPGYYQHLYLKMRPGTFLETLPFLEETWDHFLPTRPFDYSFLDETLNRDVYENEIRTGRVFSAFAGLAIFIACLGLLGLISYTTQQRRKEVGIRRVLAASIGTVVVLLSRDFLKLVVIANLIAWPVAYFVVDTWLQSFAYRINVDLTPFLLAGLAALVVSAASVSYITIRAARADPIDAIRSE